MDAVNRPAHYLRGGMECIDAVEAMCGAWDGPTGLRLGQAVAYIWRHTDKGGVQDLRKAIWYLNRQIEAMEAGEG